MLCNERIRSMREDRNLSQTEVAAILNVAQRTYSDYESGRLRIPMDRLIILAKYYDCSIDYITGASNIRRSYPPR